MEHGRRYQRHVTSRKGLQRIACHPPATPVNDIIQFPRIVPVQLGFDICFYTLVYEEERMILHFGQFIWDSGIFHHGM